MNKVLPLRSIALKTRPGMEGVGLEVVLSRSWRRDAEMSAGKCGEVILVVAGDSDEVAAFI